MKEASFSRMKKTEYFRLVRDIPYKIALRPNETDYCCGEKNKMLHQLLEELKMKVRFRECTFLWSDLNIPKKILKIPHKDKSAHIYLEVYLPKKKKWVAVDATWDSGLSDVLQVSEWDGESATSIAVKPLTKYSTKKSKRDEKKDEKDIKGVVKDLKQNKKFYIALNKWFESVRKKNKKKE